MTVAITAAWPRDLVTLADWESLDVGEGRHVECVEGVLLVAPTPNFRHQKVAARLTESLDRQLPPQLTSASGMDVVLTEIPLTVRAPDVLVIDASAYLINPPRFAASDVLLAVEVVSVASRRTDRVTKLNEYAEAGIAAYWILEGDPLTLTAYALEGGSYRLDDTYQGLVELEACGTTVRLDLDALTRR